MINYTVVKMKGTTIIYIYLDESHKQYVEQKSKSISICLMGIYSEN